MAKMANTTHIEFIKSCLRKGEKRGDILAKFGKKWQSVSIRTFDRRLEDAEDAMRAEISAINDKANKSIEKKAEELSSEILSNLERQVILSKIARGEIMLTKPMVVDKVVELVPVVPDWMDRKSAIAELNKMDGAYAPIKQEVEIREQPIDISNLTDDELRTLAEIKSKSGVS